MHKLLIISLIFLFLGCNSSEKKEIATNTTKVKMQEVSSLLVSSFMKDLKSELMKGVKDGGFENAINSCQIKAPEIEVKFTNDNPTGTNWSIKRVTQKPRNQGNTADEHELKILELFADKQNKLALFDEWKDIENKKDYYFYKPIYIGKFCLKCHGATDKIDNKAAVAIQDKYKDDKATGYEDGDLRGMFVVHISSKEMGIQLMKTLQDSL